MVRQERFVNDAVTTLNGAITAAATSITVTDGTVFPTEGDFRVIVNDEIMLVTARATHVLTVVRGIESTTAAIQADASTIRAIVTGGQFEQVIDDTTAGYSDRNPNRILNQAGTTLTHSSFTWVNQSTSTIVTDPWGGMTMKIPSTAGDSLRCLVKTAPSTPYTVTGCFLFGPGYNGDTVPNTHAGLIARESSTGELYIVSAEIMGTFTMDRWTNPTTISAAVSGVVAGDFRSDRMWLQFEDNGTNVFGRISSDGINWFQIATEGRTTFMAGGPNQIGFYINSDSGDANALFHIQSWIEE